MKITIVTLVLSLAPTPARAQEDAADPRLPVPEAEALEETRERLGRIFAERRAQGGADVGGQIVREALELARKSADPSERFATLEWAGEVLVGGADPELARAIAEELGRGFRVDPLQRGCDLLQRMERESSAASVRWRLALELLRLSDRAVLAGGAEVARKALQVASKIDGGLGNEALTSLRTTREKERKALGRILEAAGAAPERLAGDPDDAQASLALGLQACLLGEDWPSALPLLARGADAELARVARIDLEDPTEAGARIRLGDEWHARAAAGDTWLHRRRFQERARDWYERAAPAASEVQRKYLESFGDLPRDEVEALANSGPAPAPVAASSPHEERDPPRPVEKAVEAPQLSMGSKWKTRDDVVWTVTRRDGSLVVIEKPSTQKSGTLAIDLRIAGKKLTVENVRHLSTPVRVDNRAVSGSGTIEGEHLRFAFSVESLNHANKKQGWKSWDGEADARLVK